MRTTERYWAVQIGVRPHHWPYFMLENGKDTPALFATKDEALEAIKGEQKESAQRVVRVTITSGRKT